MDITGVGNLSYLYNYGIPDSDTRHVTGKENGIGSVDENGKQKECQTCKTANMSTDQMKQMYRLRVPRMFPKRFKGNRWDKGAGGSCGYAGVGDVCSLH